jgi:hypothetical protein
MVQVQDKDSLNQTYLRRISDQIFGQLSQLPAMISRQNTYQTTKAGAIALLLLSQLLAIFNKTWLYTQLN